MPRSKKERAASLLDRTGVRALIGRLGRWRGVLCFNYHRIGDGSDGPFDRDVYSASVEAFDAQVGFLKKEFDPVVAADLEGAPRGRYLLLTFDDGYRDNYEAGFPVLKCHGVRATFFITTGFLDGRRISWWDEIAWMARTSRRETLDMPRWFAASIILDRTDRGAAVRSLLSQYKALAGGDTGPFLDDLGDAAGTGRYGGDLDPWMSWDMVRALRAAGMDIGGHTVNHPVLARLTRTEQEAEIVGCIRRLGEELGERPTSFSFPVGSPDAVDELTPAILSGSGIKYAFSFYGGYRTPGNWEALDIRRVAVHPEMGPSLFRATASMPWLLA